jgi:hypothetical protein
VSCLATPPPPVHPASHRRADVISPVLTIFTSTVHGTAAPAAAGTTLAAFPAMNATDAVTPSADITIACTGPLGPGGEAITVSPGAGGTTFPLGLTIVSCTASDAADNASPVAMFAVLVACQDGYAAVGAICKGECVAQRVGLCRSGLGTGGVARKETLPCLHWEEGRSSCCALLTTTHLPSTRSLQMMFPRC